MYAYLKYASGQLEFVEIIPITPGTPPPRPQPTPPIDPNAPRPSHPIALPGDPWWGTDPPQPGEQPQGTVAIVAPVPAGTTPPATPPANATVQMITMSKDAKPTYAWIAPYVEARP